MFKKLLCGAGLFVLGAIPVLADTIEMDEAHWTLDGEKTAFTTHLGRKAIKIGGGSAELKDTIFHNGIIEFDVAMPKARGFAGVNFRGREAMAENFYLRSHQSGNPDANQYTPIFNNTSAWQIYYGPRYAAPTEYRYDEWMHVKLAVKGTKMDVYIDSDTPVLHIDNLLQGDTKGSVTLNGFLSDYYFSNVSVQHSNDIELLGDALPQKELPKGLIKSFAVATKAVDGSKVEARPALDAALLEGQSWVSLDVEQNGIANLSRVSARDRKINTLLATVQVNAAEAKKVFLKYGFSDRVTIFLNGEALAYGKDNFLSRDYRFLGTVGLYDGVFLPLKKGKNELVFAVSESFGGWAVMAAIEDQAGLTFR